MHTIKRYFYNTALQNIKSHYKKTGKFLFWIDNAKLVKNLPEYKEIGSRYQAIILEADKDFLTYQTTIDYESECGNRWQIFNPPLLLMWLANPHYSNIGGLLFLLKAKAA